MKNLFFIFIFFFLLLTPCFQAAAQSSSSSAFPSFITPEFPQWAVDLRRWDIITFGVFPFSMFLVTFTTDMFRWSYADWDNRYAPWPLKSAGAVDMTGDEYLRTIFIAAGLSAAVALVDFIIIKIRRDNERRRAQSAPSGSVIIDRRPYPEETDNPPSAPGGESE